MRHATRCEQTLSAQDPHIYVSLMTDPRRPIATGPDLDAISKFKPIKINTSFFESFAMIDRALMDTRAVMKPLLESLGKAFSDARNADAALQAGWVPFVGNADRPIR